MPKVDLSMLGELLEGELHSDDLGRIPRTLYQDVAGYVRISRNYANQKDDSIQGRLRSKEKELMRTLATRLLALRLRKARRRRESPEMNLVAEERYVLEASASIEQRMKKIQSAIANGQTAILVNIHETQAKKFTTVRFLKPLDAIMGVDLKRYGPFQPEDIAMLPLENAKPLVSQGIVSEIWLEE